MKAPIGYWIKQADELLTKRINEIHFSAGLTRTDWQVLNSINGIGQITRNKLLTDIKPFADENSLNTIIAKLKDEGLLVEVTEEFTLTAKGIELHRSCLEKQNTFRQKAMIGISEQQYEETVSTLQKIVANISKI